MGVIFSNGPCYQFVESNVKSWQQPGTPLTSWEISIRRSPISVLQLEARDVQWCSVSPLLEDYLHICRYFRKLLLYWVSIPPLKYPLISTFFLYSLTCPALSSPSLFILSFKKLKKILEDEKISNAYGSVGLL